MSGTGRAAAADEAAGTPARGVPERPDRAMGQDAPLVIGERVKRLRKERELLLGGLHPDRGAVHAGGAHRLLGLIAEESGDAEAAEEHYVTALSLLERAGAAGDLADICRLLGDLLRSEGRTEAAMAAYRTGLGHRSSPGTTTLGPAPARPPETSWD